MPIAGYGPTPIALVGIGVGAFGFLISFLVRRWGSGTSTLGVILSLSAIGWMRYTDGTLPQWWENIHPRPQAPVTTPTHAAPSPPDASDPHGVHNIFTDPGTTSFDAPAPIAPRPSAPDAAHEIPTQITPPGNVAIPLISVADARAKLDAATAAVERSLAADSTYLAAKSAVEEAGVKRKAALSASGPGSSEVLAASNDWIDAKTRLKKIVDAAAAKDLAVQAAQRDLKDAETRIRGKKPVTH
jgi:hypothetical protein